MAWTCNQYGTTWLDGLFGCGPSSVGVAPSPPVSVWTTPPANGVEAQNTVDSLLGQQLVNQNSINASGVSSSLFDSVVGGVSNYVNTPNMIGVLLVVGVIGLIAFGGGSPRRYGR